MQKIAAFLTLGAVLVIPACQRPQARHAQEDHSADHSGAARSRQDLRPAFAVPEAFQTSLGRVFEGYVVMQAALEKDDLPGAKEAFHALHAILHMMPLDGLEPASRAYWDSADARIMAALHPLAASESLDSVRFHSREFGRVMREAMERYGIAEAAEVSGVPSGSGGP